MSSKAYATPLALTRNPSLLASILYLVVLVASCAVVLLLGLAMWLSLLIVIAMVGCVSYVLVQEWMLLPNQSIKRLIWHQGNDWVLEFASGRQRQVELMGEALCVPYLVILNFRAIDTKHKYSVCLYRDSTDSESHRRLRVRLKVYT